MLLDVVVVDPVDDVVVVVEGAAVVDGMVKVTPADSWATKPISVSELSVWNRRVAVLVVEVTGEGIVLVPQVLESISVPLVPVPSNI